MAREQDNVCIRIRDSGIGIDAAMLPRIFDLFVQADNRRERATGGLGICFLNRRVHVKVP